MDTKVMYITAVVIASVAGGYYYYSGSGGKLETLDAKNVSYTAHGIKLTQTKENGELDLTADVAELTQWIQTERSQLKQLNVKTYLQGEVDATFFARQADGYNDNEKVILSGDVIATKFAQNGQLQFKTEQMTAYPKQELIETDTQVDVSTPQARFISEGLKANLAEGQYEFFNIRGNYAPRS